jgi:hypothetical protein
VPVPGVTEDFTTSWTLDGVSMPELDDQFTFTRDLGAITGLWEVTMVYRTTEVRYDPNELLTFRRAFNVGEIPPTKPPAAAAAAH